MAKKTTTKVEVETTEQVIETNTEFAKLLEIYKAQSPKKYALKEAELTRKLQANK
jgi:hypothetical protein